MTTTRKVTTRPSPEVLAEELEDERFKARFCLATGMRPADYDELTRPQINVWVEALNERGGGRG